MPDPAPNIVIGNMLSLLSDGEKAQAHHLLLQLHPGSFFGVQPYVEKFQPPVPVILPCHANCIGHSFMDPWG